VKVTRPINAVTENQPHLRNGKVYELQAWYMDGVRWAASPTCVVTSKLKALGGCSSHHLQAAERNIVAASDILVMKIILVTGTVIVSS